MSRARNCFSALNALGFRRHGKGQTSQPAERRAAPKPARIPLGDRPAYPTDEGQT
jgi:hypothetical protein